MFRLQYVIAGRDTLLEIHVICLKATRKIDCILKTCCITVFSSKCRAVTVTSVIYYIHTISFYQNLSQIFFTCILIFNTYSESCII